mgnify:CR=1 FL=1
MLRTVSLPAAVLACLVALPFPGALADPAPDRPAPAAKATTEADAARREAEEEHRKRAQAMTRAAIEAQKRALDALAAQETKPDAAAAAVKPAPTPSEDTAAKVPVAKESAATQSAAKSEAPDTARTDSVADEIAERHRLEAEAAKTEAAKDAAARTTESAAEAAKTEADDAPAVAALDAEGPAATPAPVRVDPVVEGVRTWLAGASGKVTADKADLEAVTAFYGARTGGPLWVDAKGFTANAKTALNELNRAAEWGLSPDAFALPRFNVPEPSTGALAEAEARLSLELLKYARHARGGRITPSSVSMLLDVTPPVRDPNTVIADLAKSDAPDRYLQGLHPQHEGFKLLRKALLKARGPSKADVEVDPALRIRLPERPGVLRLGSNDPEIAELRKRLKVPAEGGVAETEFDENLEIALKAFQVEQQISVDGLLGNGTRRALNREVDGQRGPDPGRMVQLIELNMERWRWLPEDLGKVHVWNNIPEYVTRVFKDDEVIFREKIIVGKPNTATPVFSADMDFVGFNPTWGMPAGIKQRELAPRLRRAAENSGGFLFFSSGPSPSDVIRAYGLNVFQNGRQINPDNVDWSRANVQNFSFVQPPGPKNPLGQVKFIYRNKHDVYMHDTIEPGLFSSSNRALSNGCIRVQNPMEFAAIMLREGNGLDEAGVQRAIRGGGEIRHTKRIPVHMVYFTAQADEAGKVSTFSDVYGLDGRISSALLGRPLPRDPASVETASTEPVQERPRSAPKGGSKSSSKYKAPQTLSDAITGFWLN